MNSEAFVFGSPWWIYYILPAGLMAISAMAWLASRARSRMLGFWAPGGPARAAVEGSWLGRWLKLAMIAGGWALVCIALARPQWGAETVDLPRAGTDLMVLVDVSNSMKAADMGGGTTRLEWARRKALDLLDLLERDAIHRVGLMAFAGEAVLLAPPTPDYGAVRFFVEDMDTGSVGIGGSALDRALDEAATILGSLPGDKKSVLIMSDGDAIDPQGPADIVKAREQARRDALAAAQDAARKGVSVYSLGIGGDTPVEVSLPDDSGARYVRYTDDSGSQRVATSRLDATSLVGVSSGGYVHSTLDDSDLRLLLARGMVPGSAGGESEDEFTVPIERFQWPLLGAFLLLFGEMFVPAGRREKTA